MFPLNHARMSSAGGHHEHDNELAKLVLLSTQQFLQSIGFSHPKCCWQPKPKEWPQLVTQFDCWRKGLIAVEQMQIHFWRQIRFTVNIFANCPPGFNLLACSPDDHSLAYWFLDRYCFTSLRRFTDPHTNFTADDPCALLSLPASPCRILLHGAQTLLHLVQVTLGYMLMLCVMSYNTWIFLGVIVGSALGYYMAFPLLRDWLGVTAQTPQDRTRPDPTWTGLTGLGATPWRVTSCSGHGGETGHLKGYVETACSEEERHYVDCWNLPPSQHSVFLSALSFHCWSNLLLLCLELWLDDKHCGVWRDKSLKLIWTSVFMTVIPVQWLPGEPVSVAFKQWCRCRHGYLCCWFSCNVFIHFWQKNNVKPWHPQPHRSTEFFGIGKGLTLISLPEFQIRQRDKWEVFIGRQPATLRLSRGKSAASHWILAHSFLVVTFRGLISFELMEGVHLVLCDCVVCCKIPKITQKIMHIQDVKL